MNERILLINPNCSISCTQGIAAAVAPFAAPGLPRIDVTRLEEGPPAIITWRDWYAVAEPLCRRVAASQPASRPRQVPRAGAAGTRREEKFVELMMVSAFRDPAPRRAWPNLRPRRRRAS